MRTTGTITARRVEVKRLSSSGMSAREIGSLLGVSHPTVLRDQKALGLSPTNGHSPTPMTNGHTPIIVAPLESWASLQDEAISNLRKQSLTSSSASSQLAKFAAARAREEAEDTCQERHVDVDVYNGIVLRFWNVTTGRLQGALVRRVALELEVDHVHVEKIVSEIIEDVAHELNAMMEARAAKLDRIEAGQPA